MDNSSIIPKSLLALSIEELNFGASTHNPLKANGVHDVADLIDRSAPDLLALPDFTQHELDETEAALRELRNRYGVNIKLKPHVDPMADAILEP